MAKRNTKPWNAVRISAPDGNVWIVGRTKIEDDYAAFLVHADGLTLGHATEKVRSSEISFWFSEQYVLDEVRRDGTRIARPSYEQLTDPEYTTTNELDDCTIEFLTL